MDHEKPYYFLYTDGREGTNLQLFALRSAFGAFKILQAEPDLPVTIVRERGAFIVMGLGLSVVQLLGQNCEASSEIVAPPKILWRTFWRDRGKDSAPNGLDTDFEKLLRYYDAIHHFGRTPGLSKHECIAALDLTEITAIVSITKKIWQAVIDEFCAATDRVEDCDIDAILRRNGAPYGVGD